MPTKPMEPDSRRPPKERRQSKRSAFACCRCGLTLTGNYSVKRHLYEQHQMVPLVQDEPFAPPFGLDADQCRILDPNDPLDRARMEVEECRYSSTGRLSRKTTPGIKSRTANRQPAGAESRGRSCRQPRQLLTRVVTIVDDAPISDEGDTGGTHLYEALSSTGFEAAPRQSSDVGPGRVGPRIRHHGCFGRGERVPARNRQTSRCRSGRMSQPGNDLQHHRTARKPTILPGT